MRRARAVHKDIARRKMRHSQAELSIIPSWWDNGFKASVMDDELCPMMLDLTVVRGDGIPLGWLGTSYVNSRICNGEIAYVYYHPDGQRKAFCKDHRWLFKRRNCRWEEHVVLFMQR